MLDRKARLNALKTIQNSCSNASPVITKEAFDAVGFLKDTFQSFYKGVESQTDKNKPILSVLNFLTVGVVTSYSPMLGIIFSILGTTFDINFTTIFNKIKDELSPILNSPEQTKNLNQNQDNIIPNIVKGAVNSNVRLSDNEINNKLNQLSEQTPSIQTESGKVDYNTIVKQAAPMGAALVQKFLPKIGLVFGGRGNLIIGLITWIVKAVLLGGGVIGATSVMESVFGVSQKSQEQPSSNNNNAPISPSNNQSSNATTTLNNNSSTDSKTYTKVSDMLQAVVNQLKLSTDSNVTQVRPNNAPNDQRNGVDGGQEWTVIGPLTNTLYKWIFNVYTNAADVFSNLNISPTQLKSAANQVAQEFINTTHAEQNADEFRIPREYNNVKDVVDAIISKIK